ncbi:hypothetical protein KJ652_01710 [Patescibacteria group bacterium]|nr:hypothetical protein [Patescibacteria group bacterium]MBU1123280.1 hypothetical protein [Patescibacteria group bacterium]MBU1910863.1 hypothetical protein [Patescibacteria group bacterium]
MTKVRWDSGLITELHEWTGWHKQMGHLMNSMCDGVWDHNLHAPLNEPRPDDNHIHAKSRQGKHEWIVASVKLDGLHAVNRREFIEQVNRVTSLNIPYR